MPAGRPRKFKNKKELENALEEYKAYLHESEKPPTIAGLAYYTGIDRKTLYNYSHKDEYFHTIKNFRNWIIMNYEEEAITRGNGGIVFLLKNYGYTDKQNMELTGKDGGAIEIDSPRDKIASRINGIASRSGSEEDTK